MTVSAVWTDFGGVLTPPIGHTMSQFCATHGLDPALAGKAAWKVAQRYGTDDIMLPLDTPLITEQEWLRQISEELATFGVEAQLTTMADAWFDGRETNHAWLEHLRVLRRRGLFVGLLSNMVPAWDPHWRRMVDPATTFDEVVLSFEVGHRKPNREIFEIAARRAGTRPEENVFVDDLAANCAGARAAGWQAIHFTDTTDAIARLDDVLPLGRQLI